MARDSVLKGGAEVRSLAIVAGEMRVRLGDVGGRALRWRPSVLPRNGHAFERGLRALTPADVHLPNLGLATCRSELQIALAAIDLPEQVRAARGPAAIVNREHRAALEQSADAHLISRGLGLLSPVSGIVKVFRRKVMVAESSRASPRQ